MRRLKNGVKVAVAMAIGFFGGPAFADGCYICSNGSSPDCKDYCRYTGQDTFQARHQCEKKGCKIGGTASCPTAVNYKVCIAPTEKVDTTVAAIPWCAAAWRS